MTPASVLRLIVLGAIWGGSFSLMRIAVAEFSPTTLIVVRLATAALFLTLVGAMVGRTLPAAENARYFLVLGVINSALPFLLFALAARHLPAASLSVFNSLAPVFGAAFGWAWFGIRLNGRMAAGLCIGILGVAAIVGESMRPGSAASSTAEIVAALFAGIAAPACYGLSANYIKARAERATPYDNAQGSLWAAAILTAPLLVFASPASAPSPLAWSALLILGVICTGAAYILSFRIIADLGSTRALTVTFLIPLFGGLWGAVLLGEPIGLGLVIGGGLVLLGTALTIATPKG